jgi:CheY-like chemotaxis protein
LREAARAGQPFGIALLDMDTPGLDGLTLARAIKVDGTIADTRILLLTTMTQQLETSQLHATKVGACLTKPLKLSRLGDYLAAALADSAAPLPVPVRPASTTEVFEGLGQLPSATPLRIIIAEDNPINQKVAKGLLARFGHNSEIVDTGRKLLRAVELAPCDIIFMDCQLPELDGLQATRELRRREAGSQGGRRAYIIAMTADAVPGARERCIEAGMDDYLSKPVRLDELHSVLRRAVEFVNLAANRGEKRAPAGVLDPQVMETLRLLRLPGQPDPLPPLIDEFIETAQSRLQEIQAAIINHEVAALEFAAHNLRGGAGGIGAVRLAALAAELEEGVRNGSLHRAAELLTQMEAEFLSVRRTLDFERER